jgi:hypothetical protein
MAEEVGSGSQAARAGPEAPEPSVAHSWPRGHVPRSQVGVPFGARAPTLGDRLVTQR